METSTINIEDHIITLNRLGTFLSRDKKAVAIVGAREMTHRGQELAYLFGYNLAKKGIDYTIISGLATGIDTVAHEAALKASGRTIAVLAHGLNYPIYPHKNADLARRITQNGCLLTPFGHEAQPLKQNFLEK